MKKYVELVIKVVLVIVLLTYGYAGNSQRLARQSVNSLGSGSMAGSTVIRQTVGQPYLGSSVRSNGLVIRPGFQQPTSFTISEQKMADLSLDVFPNPATEVLTLRAEKLLEEVTVSVVDLNGVEVLRKNFSTFDSHQIECSHWTRGIYLITLTRQDRVQYTAKLLINK